MNSLHAVEGVQPAGQRIAPGEVRYIKLGPGGAWVDRCLRDGVIEFGHHSIPHELAKAGDWARVRASFLEGGLSASKASDFTRELRDFHSLPASTLWITIARGRLWWTFAVDGVERLPEPCRGARLRRTEGGWRSADINGSPLYLSDLSTRLTKVAAYRQTLCRVEAADYLIRRINAEPEPAVARAQQARQAMTAAAAVLIAGLHWRDFELLADLIFASGGWRRVSSVGGPDQVDSDLVLEQATTGERAMVQVKSSAGQAVIDDYARRFTDGGWNRCFLVCHSPAGELTAPDLPRFHLWQGSSLAEQAVKAGLLDWLIARSR
jgi:hypothetical protein